MQDFDFPKGAVPMLPHGNANLLRSIAAERLHLGRSASQLSLALAVHGNRKPRKPQPGQLSEA